MKNFKLLFFFPFIVLLLYIYGNSISVLPITLEIRQDSSNLNIDGNVILLPADSVKINQFYFYKQDSLRHEFQIDGSDTINNNNFDQDYFQSISNTFLYKLNDWIRGGYLYNTVKDIAVIDLRTNYEMYHKKYPPPGAFIELPGIQNNRLIKLSLYYPEAPLTFQFNTRDNVYVSVYINRNDRVLKVTKSNSFNPANTIAQIYFPRDPIPFWGENLIILSRILFVSWLICIGCLFISFISVILIRGANNYSPLQFIINVFVRLTNQLIVLIGSLKLKVLHVFVVIIVLLSSFSFTIFIALYEYQGMPHILDGVTYFNQAKIFAHGLLAIPESPEIRMLMGPFMPVYQGQMFMVFPPGTSILLALGILAGIPWIVMPVLGTLSLLGTYLIGKAWFGKKAALFSLVLLALSPFYQFLAASYLSHAASLFFLVFMIYFWDKFCREAKAGRILYLYVILSALCMGFSFLTREFVTLVIGGISLVGIFLIHSVFNLQKRKLIKIFVLYSSIFAVFVAIYLFYIYLQTGSILVSPRWLFLPADKFGFGKGIGFYGEHNLAAGLLILEQLLTSIQIDLYGWPYAFTLAFMVLPFLLRKANRFDYLSLTLVVMTFVSHIPYYYHSIAIGPRHLFEALPFFVFLTVRGIMLLCGWILDHCKRRAPVGARLRNEMLFVWPVILLTVILISYNLFYFIPVQLKLYYHFTGLPNYYNVDPSFVYKNKPENTVVVTKDWYLFYNIVSAINDPLGGNEILYAYIQTDADTEKLRKKYPERKFYKLEVTKERNLYFSPI